MFGGNAEDSIVVRSNTIVGDRSHNRGMVVAKIVKGNIPVQNGVVHLIDKPLMIVARSLYEYIMVKYTRIYFRQFIFETFWATFFSGRRKVVSPVTA